MQRLRELTEEECYLRCYGWVGDDDDVRVIREAATEGCDEGASVLTERIRRAFEARLEPRDQEAA
jgi:hypothetical protein